MTSPGGETANRGVLIGSYKAEAAAPSVGWTTLFLSTIAIAERWTGKASSTLRKATCATQLPKSTKQRSKIIKRL